MSDAGPFLITSEYRRFAEFCDACRQYRYIGLCYGPPGVGKTLSARRFAAWDQFEALSSVWRAEDHQLAAFGDADTVFYTPEVVNSPRAVADSVRHLCANLRSIREQPQRRAERAQARTQAREEDRKRQERLLEIDWFAPPPDVDEEPLPPRPEPIMPAHRPPLAPVRLILVDEADRLKVPSLEQLRDLFDRSGVGLVLIGMPGIEKRLARYPQLYSRVGFVHAFHSLRAEEVRRLLAEHWSEMGFILPASGISDEAAVAAIIRITGGNFRLMRRLLAQVERLLGINQLQAVTAAVVEAARESLVIGLRNERPEGLSVKRSLSGHPRNVRKPWTADGKSDRMVAGRVNGHFAWAHVGYARVSTIDQDPALQLDALEAAGCEKVFEDRASGAQTDRAGLRSALEYVRNGDVLIVWKLDRLGRSLPHLIETVTALEKRGVGFCSITEAIDTTTSGGRLVFHLFGALGQFERDIIRERTRAGLAAAAARGRKGGRKPVVSAETLQRARAMVARGLTVREAATRLKIGKTALYEALRSSAAAAPQARAKTGQPHVSKSA